MAHRCPSSSGFLGRKDRTIADLSAIKETFGVSGNYVHMRIHLLSFASVKSSVAPQEAKRPGVVKFDDC